MGYKMRETPAEKRSGTWKYSLVSDIYVKRTNFVVIFSLNEFTKMIDDMDKRKRKEKREKGEEKREK
jgi:hypothetical protein